MKTLTHWIRLSRRVMLRVEFKAEDCWIGAFWQTKAIPQDLLETHVYICPLPMLVFHFSWTRHDPIILLLRT